LARALNPRFASQCDLRGAAKRHAGDLSEVSEHSNTWMNKQGLGLTQKGSTSNRKLEGYVRSPARGFGGGSGDLTQAGLNEGAAGSRITIDRALGRMRCERMIDRARAN